MNHSYGKGQALQCVISVLTWPAVLVILSMIGLLVVAGCGKKADPFIPKKRVSQVPQSLAARYEDGTLAIVGKLVRAEGGRGIQLGDVKLRVDYSRYDMKDAPCETCPIDFAEHEIISGKVSEKGKFTARCPVKDGKGLYVLRLRVVGNDGGLGPPSELIRVVVQ